MISKTEAVALWAKLDTALVDTYSALNDIILFKAWEPLGYPDFAGAWAARKSRTRVPAHLKALVVTTMLDSGHSVLDVRKALGPGSGITIPAIQHAEDQLAAGVPPERVRVQARPDTEHHIHRNPERVSQTLTLRLGPDAARYHRLAKAQKKTLVEVTQGLLAQWAKEADRGRQG